MSLFTMIDLKILKVFPTSLSLCSGFMSGYLTNRKLLI